MYTTITIGTFICIIMCILIGIGGFAINIKSKKDKKKGKLLTIILFCNYIFVLSCVSLYVMNSMSYKITTDELQVKNICVDTTFTKVTFTNNTIIKYETLKQSNDIQNGVNFFLVKFYKRKNNRWYTNLLYKE